MGGIHSGQVRKHTNHNTKKTKWKPFDSLISQMNSKKNRQSQSKEGKTKLPSEREMLTCKCLYGYHLLKGAFWGGGCCIYLSSWLNEQESCTLKASKKKAENRENISDKMLGNEKESFVPFEVRDRVGILSTCISIDLFCTFLSDSKIVDKKCAASSCYKCKIF